MLKMLILIKREMYDHSVYFSGAFILSAIIIMIFIPITYNTSGIPLSYPIGILLTTIVILVIGFTGMGISQMYTDKNRGLSAFLSTLPVTRDQIITARIIAGILAILTLIVPLTITTIILYKLLAPPIPIYAGLLLDIFTLILLTALACYCIGLQIGMAMGILLAPFGGLLLSSVLVLIIIIKGFSLQASFILIIFIIASLIRIRQKFLSTSL
jgi:hypothetical protein